MFFWVFRFTKNTNFLLKGRIRFFYEDIPGAISFLLYNTVQYNGGVLPDIIILSTRCSYIIGEPF